MNIAFCVSNNYFDKLTTTIVSILKNNTNENINFYILSSDISAENKILLNKLKAFYTDSNYNVVIVDSNIFSKLKLNIEHISIETYYRYIIADLLPDVDKILYLDADIVVNGSIASLWNTDLSDNYIAGCADLYVERVKYREKINFTSDDLYINAGVLLMNLKQMRRDNLSNILIDKTIELWGKIKYQDQDIINIVCKNRIKEIDCIYNFAGANSKRQKHLRKYAIIIHYTGDKKPWHKDYKNKMRHIWIKYNKLTNKLMNEKVKVGLIIDEFFGGAGTAFGGYGFLARKYIAKYIPNENIEIDVLLGKGEDLFKATKYKEDNVDLYRLPRSKFFLKRWLKKQNYDIYLSIELTYRYILECEPDPKKKLILWIQDPRPKYEWDEIETVKLFPEINYYNQKIYNLVNKWYNENRVKFVSQGYFLNNKAKDLYDLKTDVDIKYLPNPVEIDKNFDVKNCKKKNNILFLGRIESVKRGWLFCEIAKQIPEYNFYVLGQTFREKEENSKVMSPYKNIKNLHFAGHVDGAEKEQFLKDAKILVNTSIHEALPVSFLEALSYGVCLVSNRNPENLTSKFGIYTGDVLGDGFDKVHLYVDAIKELMVNEEKRLSLAQAGRTYVESIHNVEKFIKDTRDVILSEMK